MNLGLNLGIGVGGGVLLPASPSEIVQWLSAYDGTTPFVDKKSTVDSPDAVDINVLSLGTSPDVEVAYSSGFNLADQDFVVDGRLKTTDAVGGIFGQANTSSASWMAWINSGKLRLNTSPDGTTGYASIGATALNDGAFHNFRMSRYNKYGALYLDGLQDGSTNLSSPTTINNDTGSAHIGSFANSTTYLDDTDLARVRLRVPSDDRIPIIAYIGQSNCVGSSDAVPPLARYSYAQEHSYFYNVETLDRFNLPLKFTPALDGTKWGAELGVGEQLTSNGYRRCCFVKVARSGSNLYSDWQKGGTWYDEFVLRLGLAVTQLETDGYSPYISAVMWCQGEADAQVESAANNYASNFQQMQSDLRADTIMDGTESWTLSRLPSFQSYTYLSTVRAQQDSLGAFDTDALTDKGDGIHYDAASLVTLGDLFYANMDKSTIATEFDTVWQSDFSEGIGDTLYNRASQGVSNGTINANATWGRADTGYSANLESGFKRNDAIDVTYGNGTTHPFDTFSESNGVITAIETTGNIGGFYGSIAGSELFEASSDKYYWIKYRASGTASGTVNIRSASDKSGAGNTGSLNESLVLDNSIQILRFKASSANDNYLQINIGNTITANFTFEEFEIVEGAFVPALLDGSVACDGGAITNAGGYPSNDSENSLIQTDTYFTTDNSTINFYSADGATFNKKMHAQLLSHYNGSNGAYWLWVRFVGNLLIEAAQYPLDYEFTPAEVLKNEGYFGGTSAALRDGNGDLITDVNGYVVFTT